MAAINLKDILKAQERWAEKERQANTQERMSIEEFRALQKGQTIVAEKVATLTERLEEAKAEENKISNIQAESLDKISDGIQDLTKKATKGLDGVYSEIKKQTSSIGKLVGRREVGKEEREDIISKSIAQPSFRSVGDVVKDKVASVKNLFTVRGFLDQTGMVKKGSGTFMDNIFAAREHKQQTIKDWQKIDPSKTLPQYKDNPEALKAMLSKRYDDSMAKQKEIRSAKAEVDRLKEAGFTDAQIARSAESKTLKTASVELAKIDPRFRPKGFDAKTGTVKEEKEQSEKPSRTRTPATTETVERVAVQQNPLSIGATPVAVEKRPTRGAEVDFSGQKYRFLGQQWAEVNDSGKTGKMAEKGIVGQLNKLAGAGDVTEEENEAIAREEEMIDLLRKIEENTRPSDDASNIKPTSTGAQSGGIGGKLGKFGETVGKLGGAANTLLALSGALWITSKALQNFGSISWGSVFKGVGVMVALAASTKLIKSSDASKTLLALGAALWISSKAFQNFAEVDWGGLAKGLIGLGGLVVAAKAIGENTGSMLKGALGIAALGAALWVAGKGFQAFAEIDWETLAKAGVAIGGLALAAAGIGAFAAPIALGSLVLAGLGAAVWVVGEAIENVGEGIDSLVSSIERLGAIDGSNLLKVGAGLAAVAAGMVAFGAANAVAGVTNLVSGFLDVITPGKTPVEQLIEIAEHGEGIEKAGTGITSFATGLEKFSAVDKDKLKIIAELPNDKIIALGVAIGKIQAAAPAEGARPISGDTKETGKVYNQSAQNAEAAIPSQTQQSTVVAPTTNISNTTQNQVIRMPVRNTDTSVMDYFKSRYA